MDTYDLKIAAWNSRGVAAATPYMETLLKENGIVVIEEHHLYAMSYINYGIYAREINIIFLVKVGHLAGQTQLAIYPVIVA